MCIELIKGAVIEVFIFLKGLFTNYTLGEGGGYHGTIKSTVVVTGIEKLILIDSNKKIINV